MVERREFSRSGLQLPTGNQLLLLRGMGFSNLSGVELQPYALEIARSRLPNVALGQGSALAIPHGDDCFDVVFTSGVLIHIAPEDLPRAMDEIHRCAQDLSSGGWNTTSPSVTEVNYRSHTGLLWKMDYARRYLERFKDLELARERHVPYIEGPHDTVFLLERSSSLRSALPGAVHRRRKDLGDSCLRLANQWLSFRLAADQNAFREKI